jgi:hypothetical protein
VFFMASNRYNKLVKLLIYALTHPKPSKKHSHLILTPSVPAAKKAKPKATPQPPTHISPPLCPEVLLFTPLPLVSAQPLIDINAENNDKGEEEVEDDDADKPELLLLPPAVVYFMSIWKVFKGST